MFSDDMDDLFKFEHVYGEEQRDTIAGEFHRLRGQHYLEHAGATLYSEKQIKDVTGQLIDDLYANPHAKNVSSKLTDDAIDLIRFEVLQHFDTNPDEYSVVFTSGATAALKTVAETFDYGPDGRLVYLQDNHTSVLGMRQYAKSSECLQIAEAFRTLAAPSQGKEVWKGAAGSNSLYVYPAQSNFSGTKYPLEWIQKVKGGALEPKDSKRSDWYVLLDAASFAGSNPLSLGECRPDFVSLSFYKIFGYPTGLGALLVRKGAEGVLKKKYFGGGAVSMALSRVNEVVPRNVLHERFEDGTLFFLSIISLRQGFNTLRRLHLDLDAISQHTFNLAQYVHNHLLCYHHSNGQPLAVLYHFNSFKDRRRQGGIVNFNILRDNGDFIGYSEVLHMANLHNIHLRTGCFCNPGACQHHLELTSADVRRHFEAGHVCGDQFDLVEGRPTGSIRVSFGYMSTIEDAEALLAMLRDCFLSQPLVLKIPEGYRGNSGVVSPSVIAAEPIGGCQGTLEGMFLYPIKSCGAFSVSKKWPLTSTGLKYDREWMVVNSLGVCLTQKHNKRMCLIGPEVDVEKGLLRLRFPGHDTMTISMSHVQSSSNMASLCRSKVCGDKVQGWDCGDEVAAWLCKVLEGHGLRLLRQHAERTSTSKSDIPQLSLVNKAQFLLINTASVEWLTERIPMDSGFVEAISTTLQRFRPNFVVRFPQAFAEDGCEEFILGNVRFKSGGNCTRCQMICIDQSTGKASKEPLQTLSREFKGKICFGVYLNRNDIQKDDHLMVGCKAKAT